MPFPGTSSRSSLTPNRSDTIQLHSLESSSLDGRKFLQEIPAWLQREADRNLGSAIGGSAGASGAYGGKDIRQKKGSGATPGVFAKPRTALEEEESWD